MSEHAPDFSSIYEHYHGKVVSYAAKLIGRGDADDVAHEVFLKVGRSLDGLSDISRLASWIYAITLNTVRDLVRARASRAGRFEAHESDEELAAVPDPGVRTPEESAVRNEMIACYLDYVKQLPPSYYEVYVLSDFEDLSPMEIAQRLSISLATAKIRLHRARAKLHEELRRHCQCYYNERGELMGEPKRS